MLTYKTGLKVGKGTYWDISSGQRIDVEQEGVLTGEESATYLRVPASLMVLAGPIIGLLYVICMPFIGIGTVITLAAGKVIDSLRSLIGNSLSFGWRPKESYLSGKKKGKKNQK